MIREFFRFELRQQLRTPLLWLMAAMFGLLAFGVASTDAIQVGSAIGNVNRNAPTVIASFLDLFTVLGLLVIVSFVSGALLRDFELGTADLFFSSPMRKRDFLLGRFAAAMVACLLIYLFVAIGLFVAQFMPWIDPARLGPTSLAPYVWGFFVLMLPNLLFTGALLALLAVTTRNFLVVYLGVIGFFVLWAVSRSLTRDLDNVWLATLADPFGISAMGRSIRYWSAEERNIQLPPLTGYLIANRLLWTAISSGLALAAFALFKPETSGTSRAWFARKKAPAALPETRPVVAPLQRMAPAFASGTAWTQFVRQLAFDTVGVLRSVPFVVMLVFALVNFFASASLMQSLFGTRVYPVTSLMVQALQGAYSFMLIFIVMFYAGELVWKERAAKLGEVTDAFPVPNWVPLAAKMGALGKSNSEGPHLSGYLSRPWLRGLLLAPDSPAYFGQSGMEGMKSVAYPATRVMAMYCCCLLALKSTK